MKRTVLIIFIILISGNAMSLEHNSAVQDPDFNSSPGTPTCGDGVCETIEQGVCPEDCSNTDIPAEDNDTENQESKSSKKTQRNNQQEEGGLGLLIPAAGGLTILIIATVLYLSIVPE